MRPLILVLLAAFTGLLSAISTTPANSAPAGSATPVPRFELEEQGQALLIAAMQHDQQGDYQAEIEAALAALALFQQSGNQHNQITALQLAGNGALGLGSYTQAQSDFEQALAIVRDFDNPWLEARILSGLGDVASQLNQYAQAIQLYEECLAIDREIGETQGASMTLVRIGAIHYLLSDYEEALRSYQQALEISTIDQGRIQGNIGNVYAALGNYTEAERYYQQALTYFENWGDLPGQVTTLGNLGTLAVEQARPEEAQEYFLQALTQFQEFGDLVGQATTLHNLGVVATDLADPAAAQAYYQRSLEIKQEIGDQDGAAATFNNLGVLAAEAGQFAQALDLYTQALTIFQEIGDSAGEAQVLANLARLFEQQGDQATALAHYLQAIAVRETIRASVRVQALQIALASQDRDIYQPAVRLLAAAGQGAQAFEMAERNRGRAFLDSLGNQRLDLSQSEAANLLELEESLRNELAALESQRVVEKSKLPEQQNRDVLLSLESILAEKQQAYSELLTQIELSNPELATLVSVPATTLSETQALLDAQTTLVAYYLTDTGALAFVLTQTSFELVPLAATANEIGQAVQDFRNLGLANLANPTPRSLINLYGWLVAPILPYLNTPRLIIVPYQTLHYISFAALSNGEQYFGEQFVLSELPSASSLALLQEKTGRNATTALVLGNPQTDDPSLPALAYAAEEASTVAALFGTQALLAEAASETNLQAQAAQAGVIHLAAHGSFNPQAPLFSRLWLAPDGEQDGRLNVHEIYALDLAQASLVVLSACQTQVGEISGGDEVVGLNRAFLYGSPTVIASLWSVDDRATGALMAAFYTHWLAGMGKAEALQAAQTEVRSDQAHPEWAHPYYWAAFVLNGDPGARSPDIPQPGETPNPTEPASPPTPAIDEPEPIPPANFWPWIIGSGLLLGIGGWLLLLRVRKK